MKRVNSFQRTGSLRSGTARRGNQIVRTPENVETERQPLEISPRYSTRSSLFTL